MKRFPVYSFLYDGTVYAIMSWLEPTVHGQINLLEGLLILQQLVDKRVVGPGCSPLGLQDADGLKRNKQT